MQIKNKTGIPQWYYTFAAVCAGGLAQTALFYGRGYLGLGFYGLCICLTVYATAARSRAAGKEIKDQPLPLAYRYEVPLFLIVAGIAFFFRLYLIEEYPPGFWFDEAQVASESISVLKGRPFAFHSSGYFSHPTMRVYILAAFFKLFGVSALNVRLMSVIYGLLTVIPLYLIVRMLFQARLALIAAFVFASLRWHVNLSRIGIPIVVASTCFGTWAMYFMMRGYTKRSLFSFFCGGLLLGVTLHFYLAGYMFPVLCVVLCGYGLLRKPNFIKKYGKGLLIMLMGMLLTYGPLLQFIVKNPDPFLRRSRTAGYIEGNTLIQAKKAFYQTGRNTLIHMGMFNYKGDKRGRNNIPAAPMLDFISGMAFVLGMAYVLGRISSFKYFFFLAWGLLMLVPGILASGAPSANRTINVTPVVAVFISIFIYHLWLALWSRLPKQKKLMASAPVFIILAVIGYMNYHIYFNLQPKNKSNWYSFSPVKAETVKFAHSLPDAYKIYMDPFFSDSMTGRFFSVHCWGMKLAKPENVMADLPYGLDPTRDAAFILDKKSKNLALFFKNLYPNSICSTHQDPFGSPIFTSLLIPRKDIQELQGIKVSFYEKKESRKAPVFTCRIKSSHLDWQTVSGRSLPIHADWESALYIKESSRINFQVVCDDEGILSIDGMKVVEKKERNKSGVQTGTVFMNRGFHQLGFSCMDRDGRGSISITYKLPRQPKQIIPARSLFVISSGNRELLPLRLPVEKVDSIYIQQTNGKSVSGSFGAIRIDAEGCIYIADIRNCRIVKYDRRGKRLKFCEEKEKDLAPLKSLTDIAVDQHRIYAADMVDGSIKVFDNNGTLLETWSREIGKPKGLSIDNIGNIYVSESSGLIKVLNKRGQVIRTLGRHVEPGTWIVHLSPGKMAVNDQGIFVCDEFHRRIVRYSTKGDYICDWPLRDLWQNNRVSLAALSSGRLILLSPLHNVIREYDSEGTLVGIWETSKQTKNAKMITVDSHGFVYLLDDTDTLHVFKRLGNKGRPRGERF